MLTTIQKVSFKDFEVKQEVNDGQGLGYLLNWEFEIVSSCDLFNSIYQYKPIDAYDQLLIHVNIV